jgi:hypothetical protein
MLLAPDPVRAAVLAERERCKALARRELGGRAELRDRDRLLAAIDAPDETVSEYERGQRAMRKEAVYQLRLIAGDQKGDPAEYAIWAKAADIVGDVAVHTEPPP